MQTSFARHQNKSSTKLKQTRTDNENKKIPFPAFVIRCNQWKVNLLICMLVSRCKVRIMILKLLFSFIDIQRHFRGNKL